MKSAIFVLHNTAETKPSELATLAVVAGTIREAGFLSDLVVLDTTGSDNVTVNSGGIFREISAIAPDKPVGDAADYLVGVISSLAAERNASLIVGFGNIANRNWGPQVAAGLSAEFVTACESLDVIEGSLHVTGPVMGAMVQKTLAIGDRKAVLLYSGETQATEIADDISVPVSRVAVNEGRVRFIGSEALPDSGGIPLRGASKVISGGLGIGSKENWRLIEEFASKVEAAVGASRAAVEMGWVPSSRQVGFSGQKVSPDVYVAVGISGAVHHLAGIGGAKKIIAINTDPDAPIFKVADIGIVGDYEKIVDAAMRSF